MRRKASSGGTWSVPKSASKRVAMLVPVKHGLCHLRFYRDERDSGPVAMLVLVKHGLCHNKPNKMLRLWFQYWGIFCRQLHRNWS